MRRGLHQWQCAETIGVAQSTWCEWERGRTEPLAARLPSIAELLGLGVGDLFATTVVTLERSRGRRKLTARSARRARTPSRKQLSSSGDVEAAKHE